MDKGQRVAHQVIAIQGVGRYARRDEEHVQGVRPDVLQLKLLRPEVLIEDRQDDDDPVGAGERREESQGAGEYPVTFFRVVEAGQAQRQEQRLSEYARQDERRREQEELLDRAHCRPLVAVKADKPVEVKAGDEQAHAGNDEARERGGH